MKLWSRIAPALALCTLGATAATAGCGVESGSVRILGNDFGALHAVTERARECGGDGVTVEVNLTSEHRDIQVAALTANPAQYTVALVANSSIVPLLNADLVRPLDDLVEKYGQSLNPRQLIKVDGKTVAVAFMANAQHLYYRKDILEENGIPVPTTYEEVIAAGKALREAGVMAHPYAAITQVGWNLGEEFVNMYLGHGGSFFVPGQRRAGNQQREGRGGAGNAQGADRAFEPRFPDLRCQRHRGTVGIGQPGAGHHVGLARGGDPG